MLENYEIIDQICVSLAREIKDNESCYTGIAIPLAIAAIQLARISHAPNLNFYYGGHWVNPDLDVDLFTIMTDEEAFKKALQKAKGFSKLIQLYQYWEGPKFTFDFAIIRPAQIDRNGNINNSIIGDFNNPKVRLPGGAAIADIVNTCYRILAYIPRHDTKTFVEEVDFITCRGASRSWRKNVGLEKYQGITSVITDLGIFDFNTTENVMRVRSIHEFSTLEEVISNTGFELKVPDPLPITKPPTEKEMNILQNKADPLDVRKFDFRARK